MELEAIDHMVLTVRDIPASVAFCSRVPGMRDVVFGENRHALAFGRCKLSLHQAGRAFEQKAAHPAPGAADLWLLARTPIAGIVRHLAAHNVAIEEGPVERTGAQGPLL